MDWNAMAAPSAGGLLGDHPENPELQGLLGYEGLLGNPYAPPPSLGPFRLWPDSPNVDFWQQFHDEQLYRNTPRDQIPPRMRPPIDVPGVDPVFPDDRWGRLISQR